MLAYTFYESDNRVRRYAESLVKHGYDVDAIVLRRDGQNPFEVISGVNVHRIQTRVRNERSPVHYLLRLVSFLIRSAWVLTRFHLRSRYHLIHVHSVPDFEVFATVIPRLMGARVILDIHDIVPELYGSKFKIESDAWVFRLLVLLEKISSAYSHHVIIANHLWEEKLTQRSVPPSKCTTIINYPDLSIFRRPEAMHAAKTDFLMCYPGTLNWHQGVDRAIAAVAQLRYKLPNLKFLIVGDGPDREKLKAMVKEQGLQDLVQITSTVPMEAVAATMAAVDLGVVPKRKDSFGDEAFSTKILEFMAMGVPVLASNTRIDQYYFNDGIVQFFDSESTTDLADKILALAHDPVRCSALREGGIKYIGENNWDVKCGQYLDLVDRLVQRTTQNAGRNAVRLGEGR